MQRLLLIDRWVELLWRLSGGWSVVRLCLPPQGVSAACKRLTVNCLVLFASFEFGVFRIMKLYEVVIGRENIPEPCDGGGRYMRLTRSDLVYHRVLNPPPLPPPALRTHYLKHIYREHNLLNVILKTSSYAAPVMEFVGNLENSPAPLTIPLLAYSHRLTRSDRRAQEHGVARASTTLVAYILVAGTGQAESDRSCVRRSSDVIQLLP